MITERVEVPIEIPDVYLRECSLTEGLDEEYLRSNQLINEELLLAFGVYISSSEICRDNQSSFIRWYESIEIEKDEQ